MTTRKRNTYIGRAFWLSVAFVGFAHITHHYPTVDHKVVKATKSTYMWVKNTTSEAFAHMGNPTDHMAAKD